MGVLIILPGGMQRGCGLSSIPKRRMAHARLDSSFCQGPFGMCNLPVFVKTLVWRSPKARRVFLDGLSKKRASKSRITPQIHRAGRKAGVIKPVHRAGWEWAASLPQQQRAAWAECTCASAHVSIFLSFSIAGVSSILSPSRSAMSRSASKWNTGAEGK